MLDLAASAAYGGERWAPRTAPLRDEIGAPWAPCGLRDENLETPESVPLRADEMGE